MRSRSPSPPQWESRLSAANGLDEMRIRVVVVDARGALLTVAAVVEVARERQIERVAQQVDHLQVVRECCGRIAQDVGRLCGDDAHPFE
eukprot:2423129-Prymnesium_polylepis.2